MSSSGILYLALFIHSGEPARRRGERGREAPWVVPGRGSVRAS